MVMLSLVDISFVGGQFGYQDMLSSIALQTSDILTNPQTLINDRTRKVHPHLPEAGSRKFFHQKGQGIKFVKSAVDFFLIYIYLYTLFSPSYYLT